MALEYQNRLDLVYRTFQTLQALHQPNKISEPPYFDAVLKCYMAYFLNLFEQNKKIAYVYNNIICINRSWNVF